MNNIPMIDPRKAEDIIRNIKQKAQVYTPEWNYEPGDMDGGAAIAELFSQMFGETIERLNNVPYKNYMEFLNLLEVSAQSVKPSTGIARVKLTEGGDKSVPVKKGTQMYCDITDYEEQGEAKRIIFETEKDFTATPAEITGLFSVNPRSDIIEKLDLEQNSAKFFDPSGERNLQRHRFAVANNDVLRLSSPADITLRLENTALGYLNEEYVSRLADPSFSKWTYFDGSRQLQFDRVYAKDGKLHLIKDNDTSLMPQKFEAAGEETTGEYWICCDLTSIDRTDEIIMNRINIGSTYLHKEKQGIHIGPQHLYANDIVLDQEEGGYCFGKQPMSYDCFYISSDEVFSKRNSRINIEFDLKTVIRQIGTMQEAPQYNFNKKYIVEKADVPVVNPDTVFISKIVWEYWNGAGWAHLKADGDLNPFNGQEGSFKKQISFQCPQDMSKSLQNSIESYWIRARVVEVENMFSVYANLMLPYVEAVSLDFDYSGMLQPSESVYTDNNCLKAVYNAPDPSTAMKLYQPMAENVHAVYFAFDLPPSGYPVNLYFKTEGRSKTKRMLNFEYLTKDVGGDGVWRELKVSDGTEGLEEDGIISIYAPRDFKKDTLFGHEGYWLRIADKNLKYIEKAESYPVVQKIVPNVVEIIQKQTVLNEMFNTGIYESGKEIVLANRPVLECQVWVNEISDISKSEMAELAEKSPDCVDIQYNSSGHISEFWVKWDRQDSLIYSGGDSRHYTLDSFSGRITFGNGKKGKVPSNGESTNIRVDYSFGGGKKGNLPENTIEGLIVSLPYVDNVTNLEITCGGSDKHDIKTLEKVGPQKLRHRGRAVTASDFENIVLEHYPEIRDVKCVPNYDRLGQQAWGHVTLVIMPYDIENRSFSLKLCKKIEQHLSSLISCELLEGGRFSVVPAVVMKVSATVSVTLENYEAAAETERQVIDALTEYLNPVVSSSQRLKIEEVPAPSDFYKLLKKIRNVANIQEIILEGRYYEGNQLKVIPIGPRLELKYVVVASGEHAVKIL